MPEYFEDEFVIKSRDGRRKLKFNLGITNLLDYFFELFPNGRKSELATKGDIIEQKNVEIQDWNTTGGETGGILGRLKWNSTDKTLDLGVGDGSVTLQLGQELHTYCINKTGADIPNFSVVRISGSMPDNGVQRPSITLAQANSFPNSETTYGVTTQAIPHNSSGMVTTYGLVRDVDTQPFTEGEVLYLSPTEAGKLVNTSPQSPNFRVPVALCVKKHPLTGTILVDVHRSIPLSSLTGDTLITNPTNGQVLKYDGTKWVNGTLSETLTLNNLSDVSIIAPTEGDTLIYAGGNWENTEGAMFKSTYDTNGDGRVNTAELLQTSGDPDAWSSISITDNFAQRPTFDGNNIFTGTNTYNAGANISTQGASITIVNGDLNVEEVNNIVAGNGTLITPTELSYIGGVTSNIQTQISSKSPIVSPTFTGNVVLPSTTTIGLISSTEIANLNNSTSNIQDQLDVITEYEQVSLAKLATQNTFSSTNTFNGSTILNLLTLLKFVKTSITASGNLPTNGNFFSLNTGGTTTTLLTGTDGRLVILYKNFSGAGNVTISGHINGVAATNIVLTTQYDFAILISSNTTWVKLICKIGGAISV